MDFKTLMINEIFRSPYDNPSFSPLSDLAPQAQDWNTSISSITFSSVEVIWEPYIPDNAFSVHIYAVICVPISYDGPPIVMTANNTQRNLEVRKLRGFAEYNVQVLALTTQTVGGTLIRLKGSQKHTITTKEGGKYIENISHLLFC